MKAATIVGILLIVFGIFSLVSQGITYTQQKKVIDLGPVQATTEEQKRIPLPPILGAISLVGGIALVVAGTRRQ